MEEFRQGNSRILISTDLWGRGLDVQQVNILVYLGLFSYKL